MDRPIVFMAVTNDDYEFPVRYADTTKELADFLGISTVGVTGALLRSPDGVVHTIDRKFKYMRINPNTGEIYVGKLPQEVNDYLKSEGIKARKPRTGRPIIYTKDGVEIKFRNVAFAEKVLGIKQSAIYTAIRTQYRCAGALWRYA